MTKAKATKATPVPCEPWTAAKARELARRPGVVKIYLLTDEAGAAMLRDGLLPTYLQQQAIDALAWQGSGARRGARGVAPDENKGN